MIRLQAGLRSTAWTFGDTNYAACVIRLDSYYRIRFYSKERFERISPMDVRMLRRRRLKRLRDLRMRMSLSRVCRTVMKLWLESVDLRCPEDNVSGLGLRVRSFVIVQS